MSTVGQCECLQIKRLLDEAIKGRDEARRLAEEWRDMVQNATHIRWSGGNGPTELSYKLPWEEEK